MSKKTDKDADTGSILGNIILEEVVEAIEEARSPRPDIFPPIPHEAPQPKGTPAVNKREDEQESPRKRPDAPGHHSR